MFQPVSLFIGFRYSKSRHHKGFISFITFFSITGILLGVASLIIVVSVMNGFENELKSRILGLVPHVVVKNSQGNIPSWTTVQHDLASIPHIQRVTPFAEDEALIQSPSALEGVMIQGIVPSLEQQHIVVSHITQGDFNQLSEQPYSVILGESLARKLSVQLGDTVRVLLPNSTQYTPMGRVPVQRNVTVVALFNVGSQIDSRLVLIHHHTLNKFNRRAANSVQQLRLYLDDAFSAQAVVEQLKQRPIWLNQIDQIETWQVSQGQLFSAVKMEKNMMWLMLSLIVAVAAFNIVSALVMVVIEKQGEIAILKTLGLNQLAIIKIFITQGMVNGVWGATFGAVLGIIITLNINPILSVLGVNLLGSGYGTQQLPTDLQLHQVAIIVVSALLMSFLACLYPAYRASKTQPAEVLRNE
jgi:lipoprotein-releasing system permease protein